LRIGDFLPLFGGNIRYLRGCCGLSRRVLGKLVGVSIREIRKLEDARGTVHVDYRMFMRLIEIFGVDGSDMTEKDLRKENFRLPVYASDCFPAVYENSL